MGEPVKLSFGFSKVATKKPPLVAAKPLETIEYIKCVEDNAVKLVNETVVKPKELPVIPMPPGSSVRDRILEAIKAREEARGGNKKEESSESKTEPAKENGTVEAKPLTLDEMAAKELLEGAAMETEEKKEAPVIAAGTEDATRKESTLDDYESMPINDFGLAMLRGMGWDPSKGIGLNEKVVTPVAPQLRPKGMGLGADKALAAQTKPSKSNEELIMKKGSMVKVITGPYIHLYGIVEGFEELPGRILVRLTLSNASVSLSEFMVQLVGPTEYNKNSKVMNLDKYNEALDNETKPPVHAKVKSEANSEDSKPYKREQQRRERSRSPRDEYSGRSKSGRSNSKRDRSEDRSSSRKERYRDAISESDSDSHKYRKKSGTDRRSKKSNKPSKYSSESSDSEKKRGESSRDRHGSKHSKHKSSSRSYRSDSDSDSSKHRHRKKHKKSRK